MSKSNAMENNLLRLVFQQVTWPNVADIATAGNITNIAVSLHTADPGEAGTQATNEVTTTAYAGYTRIGVNRTTTSWLVTGNVASPVANISFPQASGGTGGTISFFGLGNATSGAGTLMYSGTVTPNIAVANGVTPILTTGSTVTES